MEKIEFRDLSIADLLALHTNYWLTEKLQPGARFKMITEQQFRFIEAAIVIKVGLIQFPKLNLEITTKS